MFPGQFIHEFRHVRCSAEESSGEFAPAPRCFGRRWSARVIGDHSESTGATDAQPCTARDEIPLNHMDMPPEEMPKTRADMKDMLDRVSRWLN